MARLRTTALLLLLGLAAAAAQGVVFNGPAGCADLPPSPPVGLTAVPAGSGRLLLTWTAPANGACVDEYQVSVGWPSVRQSFSLPLHVPSRPADLTPFSVPCHPTSPLQVTVLPVDAATARTAPLPPQRSTSFNLTVSGLTNGQQYKCYVKAFSSKYRGGGEALVVAAPRAPCNPRVLPSQPTDLTIRPGSGQLEICWGAPAAGCPDAYRVGVRVADSSRRGAPLVREYPQGGCVNVTGLVNGEFYEVRGRDWEGRGLEREGQGSLAGFRAPPGCLFDTCHAAQRSTRCAVVAPRPQPAQPVHTPLPPSSLCAGGCPSLQRGSAGRRLRSCAGHPCGTPQAVDLRACARQLPPLL